MRKQKEYEQLDLFSFSDYRYQITKSIRLIEFFAGVGFQRMGIEKALKGTNISFESWRTTEWAIPSILAYDIVHNFSAKDTQFADKEFLVDTLFKLGVSINYNESAKIEQLKRMNIDKLSKIYNAILRCHNLVNIMNVKGDDLGITDTDKYEYILTYSFPCQDLSLAGNGAGMSVSQKEGGSRSGLVWEVLRILQECKEKPQVLIMENVTQVHSKDNINEFNKLQLELEKLGYRNFWKDINGVDVNVPQNRVRTFMVSIHNKDAVYSFPHREKLTRKLMDILEPVVDEKYYLSKKMIDYISATGTKNFSVNNSEVNCSEARPITTEQNKRAGTTNYIADDRPENYDIRPEIHKIGNYGNGHHAKDVVGTDGLSPTITTGNHGLGQAIAIKNANSKGYELAEEGDGIDISTRMESHRGTVQKGRSQTLTCSGGENVGVVVRGTYQFAKSDSFMQGKDRFQEGKDVSDCLQTNQKEGIVVEVKDE